MLHVADAAPPMPMPEFATTHATNELSRFVWGLKQYVACVQLENSVALARVDTGGHCSAIDFELACALGLNIMLAEELDCSTY